MNRYQLNQTLQALQAARNFHKLTLEVSTDADERTVIGREIQRLDRKIMTIKNQLYRIR